MSLRTTSTMMPTEASLEKFAVQQSNNVDGILTMTDEEIQQKLNDLKKFGDTFKLHTPVLPDLLSIVTNDSAKRKKIQEKSRLDAKHRIGGILKSLGIHCRMNFDQLCHMKPKDDKDTTLNGLKKVADDCQPRTPFPPLSDMTKDAAMPKGIQEKAECNANARIRDFLDSSITQHRPACSTNACYEESKMNDLRKFAAGLKLRTPIPSDLLSIIANDPAKQMELQEKAKHSAEEAIANCSEHAKPFGRVQ